FPGSSSTASTSENVDPGQVEVRRASQHMTIAGINFFEAVLASASEVKSIARTQQDVLWQITDPRADVSKQPRSHGQPVPDHLLFVQLKILYNPADVPSCQMPLPEMPVQNGEKLKAPELARA